MRKDFTCVAQVVMTVFRCGHLIILWVKSFADGVLVLSISKSSVYSIRVIVSDNLGTYNAVKTMEYIKSSNHCQACRVPQRQMRWTHPAV
jgi:hypothetical protein